MSSAMQITKPASWQDMTKFHTDEYIAFLKNITPDIQDRYQPQMDRCMISLLTRNWSNAQITAETIVQFGLVCTNFAQSQPGKQYRLTVKAACLLYSGSIGAAQKLNHGDSDIAIKYYSDEAHWLIDKLVGGTSPRETKWSIWLLLCQ